MITGLIDVNRPVAPETIDGLTDTLACLVAGVAASLIGDAVIIARQPDETLAAIAEGAGASFVVLGKSESPWEVGARLARREWLLCLEAGDVPREGWIRVLDRFTATSPAATLLGRMRRPHAGLVVTLRTQIEKRVGTSVVRAGDVVRRDHWLARGTSARMMPRHLMARIDRA